MFYLYTHCHSTVILRWEHLHELDRLRITREGVEVSRSVDPSASFVRTPTSTGPVAHLRGGEPYVGHADLEGHQHEVECIELLAPFVHPHSGLARTLALVRCLRCFALRLY